MTVSISNMSQVWMSNTNTYNAIAMSVSTMGYGANANSRLLLFKVDGNTKFDLDTNGVIRVVDVVANTLTVNNIVAYSGLNYLPNTSGASFTGDLYFPTGNVGIGTTSPASKLDVRSTGLIATFGGSSVRYNGIAIRLSDASSSNLRSGFFDVRNENNVAVANFGADVNTDGSSNWYWTVQDAGTRTNRLTDAMRLSSTGANVSGSLRSDTLVANSITTTNLTSNNITTNIVTSNTVTSNTVTSNTVNAAIYYDSSNTNFYLDPASTSNLFAANFQRPLFVPRYTLYFDATSASRTTPNTFTKSYTASHVSFGSILGQFFRTFNVGGSFQFEMTVSCSSATSVTTYLMYIDDNVYFFLNGGLIGSATGAGNKNYSLTWNLLQGTNTIQIIFNNSGGSDGSINFMADFFQNGNTAFISP